MISVIIPVYNTAKYLDKCIQSVVDQTYKDLEIILIDDCSTDGSSDLLDIWKEKDNRIKVIHKKHNSGVSNSRNIGMEIATGDFIAFVDSDDWIKPIMYFEMVHYLEETGADIAFSGYERISEDDTLTVLPKFETGTVVTREDALLECIPQRGTGRYNLYIWNKLFKRKAIVKEDNDIKFNPQYSYGEDILWFTSVMLNIETVVFCRKAYYNYRATRSGNTWTALSQYKDLSKCKSALATNMKMLQILKEAGSSSVNNQQQRVLYYQCYTFRTAAKMHDLGEYEKYKSGYVKGLIIWFAGNRTLIGCLWLIKQLGEHFLFLISN